MYITRIRIKNFRLLKNSTLEMKKDLSLLVGKNNSGKTSLLVLFEKFYENKDFAIDDFPLSVREDLRKISQETDMRKLSIQLIIEIAYDESDNLENLSELLLDLDPNARSVKILFECTIDKDILLKDLASIDEEKKPSYIEKNIHNYFVRNVYSFKSDSDLEDDVRTKIVKKEIGLIRKIINFQILHARRDVASSESKHNGKKVLSSIATNYFNKKNKDNSGSVEIKEIGEILIKMDEALDDVYEKSFENFLNTAKDFLSVTNLKVASRLEATTVFENSSHILYGKESDGYLPEHLNGLGYMNILYLLLTIEIKKENFTEKDCGINLLFIEEPEAHTHPQMQYVFSRKIKNILSEVKNLQTIITTHSSHIVSQCSFEDIRYLVRNDDDNVLIKNFHEELGKSYTEPDEFKFLQQYLTLQSSELFFADKVIFIEGTSEKILLPYFIKKFDSVKDVDGSLGNKNISILEVGANSRVFEKFLNFLNIKTLIITDIDTTKSTENGYLACRVSEGESSSNYSLKHYFDAPDVKHAESHGEWMKNLKNGNLKDRNSNLKIVYQTEEGGYHARSFEDAFISKNFEELKKNRSELWGIKNIKKFDDSIDVYLLTEKIIDKKSDFAASVLYLAYSKDVDWATPAYIENGLSWLAR